MKTLSLSKPWSFVSPQKTIDYPAGDHEVAVEIYAKALAEGAISEESDGNGSAKTGQKGAAGKAEG